MTNVNLEDLLNNVKEAYALLKETEISQTLKNAAIEFTSWFGGLFTRKLHKEKVGLLEQLSTNDEVINSLKAELEAQMSENESLKEILIERLNKFNEIKSDPQNSIVLKAINSTLKNIVNAPITNVQGNITIGDTINNK